MQVVFNQRSPCLKTQVQMNELKQSTAKQDSEHTVSLCSASGSELTDCSRELERKPREDVLTRIKQHVALEPTHAAHCLA